MRLTGTQRINENGSLEIGGITAGDLARKFGTPLYVMDEKHMRDMCRVFRDAFSDKELETEVIYASKAYLNLAMAKLINEEGLSLDVVSGGELHTALTAGFPPGRIYFHGNNKGFDEILMAINAGVGRIVVDNETELDMINMLATELDRKVNILLRMNPGIEAHTHDFIKTASNDSKFGTSIYSEKICNVISEIGSLHYVTLKGFHYHIGSQIFDEKSFYKSLEIMMEFVSKVKRNCLFETAELNLGGGFGVYYSGNDDPMDLKKALPVILTEVKRLSKEYKIPTPKLMIEPGRAIVANAGTTLYKVGSVKDTFGGKSFVFVDGGMTDNPRTALYDSVYEAVLADKATLPTSADYTVAGKLCESGDVLIKGIGLPSPETGDVLAVLSTGAYNYSMSSNYNRLRKPAGVFVSDGKARLVLKRETYDDLIRNDVL